MCWAKNANIVCMKIQIALWLTASCIISPVGGLQHASRKHTITY